MSISEVTARINEIQSQLAMLTPQQDTSTAFAQTMGAVSASSTGLTQAAAGVVDSTATATTAAVGTTGTTSVPATGTSTATTATSGTTTTTATTASSGDLPLTTPWAELFRSAEAKYGVDAKLLSCVARQESSFNPNAVSSAGAKGLMQLMPATAKSLGVTDPMDPAQSVDGAARLLRDLLKEFGTTELALAAYNAGSGAVHRYGRVPPYPETQNYVRTIMADLEKR